MLLVPAQSSSPPSVISQPTSSSHIQTTPAAPILLPPSTSTAMGSSSAKSPSTRWAIVSSRTTPATPFVYAVKSTKIYCLPTCPSRLARRANVTFYDTPEQAEAAGYRACKRCKPNYPLVSGGNSGSSTLNPDDPDSNEQQQGHEPVKQKIEHAVSIIRSAAERGEKVSLADLSAKVGLSKWHLQRVFKARMGRSPMEMGNEILEAAETTTTTGRSTRLGSFHSSTAPSVPAASLYPSSAASPLSPISSGPYTNTLITRNNPNQNPTEPSVSPSELSTLLSTPTFQTADDFSSTSSMMIPQPPLHTLQQEQDYPLYYDDFMDYQVTTELPEAWSPGVEDVLRDLFPEIYAEGGHAKDKAVAGLFYG